MREVSTLPQLQMYLVTTKITMTIKFSLLILKQHFGGVYTVSQKSHQNVCHIFKKWPILMKFGIYFLE